MLFYACSHFSSSHMLTVDEPVTAGAVAMAGAVATGGAVAMDEAVTGGALGTAEVVSTAKSVAMSAAVDTREVTVAIMMEGMAAGKAVVHRRSNASLHANRPMASLDGWDAPAQVRHLTCINDVFKRRYFNEILTYTVFYLVIPPPPPSSPGGFSGRLLWTFVFRHVSMAEVFCDEAG